MGKGERGKGNGESITEMAFFGGVEMIWEEQGCWMRGLYDR